MKKTTCGPQTWIFPMPALLVGTIVDQKPNFMTVAWGGIAAKEPPALTVAINKTRYTLKGIRKHKVFSVNIPAAPLVKEVDYCGIFSGKNKDKTKLFTVFYGMDKNTPLIEQCPVNIECKVLKLIELESHVLVLGEILETHINSNCLENGKPVLEKIDPLIYSPGIRLYNKLGAKVATAFKVGKEII